MTIEERAEKLVSKLVLSRCTGEPEFFHLVKLIEDQLTQACAEARAEITERKILNYGMELDLAYTRGYSDAKEMAVKLAESRLAPTEYAEQYSKAIAERIRAMRAKETTS